MSPTTPERFSKRLSAILGLLLHRPRSRKADAQGDTSVGIQQKIISQASLLLHMRKQGSMLMPPRLVASHTAPYFVICWHENHGNGRWTYVAGQCGLCVLTPEWIDKGFSRINVAT